MKVKSKKELLQEIDELKELQLKAIEKSNAAQKQSWDIKLPFAIAKCQKSLNEIFCGMIKNLIFEHVDEAGYWFTFELINDSRRQTYEIRHNEIEL